MENSNTFSYVLFASFYTIQCILKGYFMKLPWLGIIFISNNEPYGGWKSTLDTTLFIYRIPTQVN